MEVHTDGSGAGEVEAGGSVGLAAACLAQLVSSRFKERPYFQTHRLEEDL